MTIPVPFTGGCACGAVRYECTAEPLLALNCHCRECQRFTGSAYTATLIVPKAALTVTGRPKYYDVATDSGGTARRFFCGDCGSPLYAIPAIAPDVIGLRAGGLDDPSIYTPTIDVWTDSAQPWDCIDPELPKCGQQPRQEEFHTLLAREGNTR